jgi:hypothetical protein
MTAPLDLPSLRPADRDAVSALPDVVGIHPYTAHWFNNATFVLPVLATIGTLIAWAAAGSDELLGISIFSAIITVLMLPLVRLTWVHTPTVIALTQERILALHQGRQLKSLAWTDVVAVRKQDTMGNIRWYIVAQDEEYISVEGEIDQIDTLLETARRLAGLDPEPED